MNYLHWDYTSLKRGAVANVTLKGVESDVMLLSPSNYSRFQRGDSFQYYGGHYKKSPVRLVVPSSGSWHVVVIPGSGGRVDASVTVTDS
jgi:Domain of unknown function (DUF1883)